MRKLHLVPCLSFLLSAAAQADVKILELPDQTPLIRIQDAIELAPEGATLLLGQNDYEAFVIQGKSLTLIQVETGPTIIRGVSRIQDLGPGQAVVLRGLEFIGLDSQTVGTPALRIQDCAGPVRLDDCTITGGGGLSDFGTELHGSGGAALEVDKAINLALTNCHLEGGRGGTGGAFTGTGGDGGDGLLASDSDLALYGSILRGGLGGFSGTYGGDGGTGARIDGGELFAGGTTFRGGNGGDAKDFIVAEGGRGGDGLSATADTNPRLVDNVYAAGVGGAGLFGPGPNGVPRFWGGGALSDLPGTSRSLQALEPIVASGDSWSVRVQGQPGDQVWLMLSPAHGFRSSLVPVGVWLVPFPALMTLTPSGTFPGTGFLDLQLPAPPLLGRIAQRYSVQAFVSNQGSLQPLTGSVQVLGLDASAFPDCNLNGEADLFEVLDGRLEDCDGNLIPDSCDFLPDCNGNGIVDTIDIDCGRSVDANLDGIPDECTPEPIYYVDDDAAPGGDGSLTAPFDAIGDAFNVALEGTTIVVRPGTYRGPENRRLDFGRYSIEVVGTAGASATVIDCEGVEPAFLQTFQGGLGTARIEGIAVRDGYSRESDEQTGGDGGGGYFEGSVTLVDCQFTDCFAERWGGAVSGPDLTLLGCNFTGNVAAGRGGAVDGSVRASRCVFDSNSAFWGGAVRSSLNDSFLAHCIFRLNTATERGGAIAEGGAVDNCFFALNEAPLGGAISTFWFDTFDITSCTFVKNISPGGSVLHVVGDDVTIVNSLAWLNDSPAILFTPLVGSAELDIAFSNLEGGTANIDMQVGNLDYGTGNIELDPLFVNPAVGDYRLGAGSPCLDAGRVGALAEDVLDVDGDGNTIERVPLDALLAPRRVDDPAADTGFGPAPLPDMGALERG